MAPTGLQSFMERNEPRSYRRVDIVRAVREHRAKQNNQQQSTRPLIVMDGCCARRVFLEENSFHHLTGGQFKIYKRRVDDFIDFFENLDVRLVVFFDGGTVAQMRDRWISRKTDGTLATQGIFDSLECGGEIEEHDILTPVNIDALVHARFVKRCEVIMSMFMECDAEIVRYANAHGALAILSQDADFAVSQGGWQYWSLKDVDFKRKETRVYDRQGLADVLGLKVDQLPLFRTMIGNDYIIFDTLDKFFSRTLGVRYNARTGRYNNPDKLVKVARYVRDYDNSMPALRRLAEKVFGDAGKAELIKESVESYFGREYQRKEFLSDDDAEWNALLRQTLRRLQESKITPKTFDVMLSHVFEMSNSWEDFRKPDIPPAGVFWRPLRANIYSILLRDCPVRKPVEEWVCTGDMEEMKRATFVEPVVPPGCEDTLDRYGLKDFWIDGNQEGESGHDEDVIDAAWKVFCACFNENLPVAGVQGLDTKLVLCCLVTLMMAEPCHMTDTEIEAFLMTCALCSKHKEDVSGLCDEGVYYRINTRGLRLSTVYLRGVFTVTSLLEALGYANLPLESAEIWNIFDGALYQTFVQDGQRMDKYRKEELYVEAKGFFDEFRHLFG